jgi:putative peptidoglycan lipid II flippase
MSSKRQIVRSSMVVGFFSLLGSLTGILVETSIAAKLGLSKSSDTFYVAFTVPYIMTNLISATGQFSLVPFFSSLDARHSSEELWRGFSYAVNVVFLALAAVAAAGSALAPLLIHGIAPGFTPDQIELAGRLARWLFIIIIPAGVAETIRSFLLSQHRFAIPSAAGFFRNALVIVCVLLTFHRFGMWSIVLGYFAGYLVQFAVLGSQLFLTFPVKYVLTLESRGEAFRNLRGAGTAQVAVAFAWQGVVVAERIIASFLPAGTLTALNYGFKIMSTLAELLAGSVGTAGLPVLSKAFARGDLEGERKNFRDMLEIGLALVTPALVFCLLLDRPIVRLIFERGNFTPQATDLMAMVFFYYCLSLPLFAFIRGLTFHLFARNESSRFLRLSLFQYGMTVSFDLIYVGLLGMGAMGIPLGLVTALSLTTAIAYLRNLGDLKETLDRAFASFLVKNLVGAGLAALTVWALGRWIAPPLSAKGNFVYLCVLCGAGSLGFLATLVVSRAVPFAHILELWERTESS